MFCQPLLLACKRQGNVDMLESFLWQICLSAAVSAGTATEQVWMKKSDIVVGFPCSFNASSKTLKLACKGKETLKAMTSWLAIFWRLQSYQLDKESWTSRTTAAIKTTFCKFCSRCAFQTSVTQNPVTQTSAENNHQVWHQRSLPSCK